MQTFPEILQHSYGKKVALGGIKAVIYTDTVQWIILLSGLSLIGVPFALKALGA